MNEKKDGGSRVNEKKTVTVAGVPARSPCAGRELAVQIGRFDPQAAAGRLCVSPLSGTAAVAVNVAGEGGPDGAGERWVAGLYPAPPSAAEQLLLCDGCFQAATGLLAGCQDGCTATLAMTACACATAPSECQWCGARPGPAKSRAAASPMCASAPTWRPGRVGRCMGVVSGVRHVETSRCVRVKQ